MDAVLIIPVLFLSVVLHEFAHGAAAYRLGDDTAYLSGRLTLNPLAHIDPVGTLAVPALCFVMGWPAFGWAKPVPVNVRRLPSPRRDMGKVALAGPAVNLLLALVLLLVLKLMLSVPSLAQLIQNNPRLWMTLFQSGIYINILLAVFNLMPVPPLDGGRIVVSLLPAPAAARYQAFFGRYGMWVVIVLIVTGVFSRAVSPLLNLTLRLFNKILMM